MNRTTLLCAILTAAWTLTACGDGTPPPGPPIQASLTGLAWIDGPVAEAAVEVYALSDGQPSRLAFATSTDAAGRFALEMGPANGDLLVRVLSPGGPLEVGLFAFPVGGRADVRVTPITHLATAYARWRAAALDEPAVDAILNARRLVYAHFGGLDHEGLDPVSFTDGPDRLDAAARVGLMLDGLRWQARRIAESAGLSPDGRVTTYTLIAALASDLDDGMLDGRSAAGPLELAGQPLSADTLRADYALALARFLQSEANAARFTPDDVRDQLDAIEQATGPLFPPERPTGRLDIEPPVITLNPAGGIARGELRLEVLATDASPLTAMRFTTPPLDAIEAVIDQGRGTLRATVDTLQMADGPWGITVEATDARGNVARQTATFTIANTGPAITVLSPEADGVVRGVVSVEARADDPDDVTALALVEPAGLADLEPMHDTLRVELDTAAHPDGPLTLAFVARDAAGNETRQTITVTVDNVPVGHLAGVAHLGGPIRGAVVEAWALDADGQPTQRVDLCEAPCRTDDEGRWAIPVTDAYAGPLRVVLRSNPLQQASHLDAYTGDPVLWPEGFTLSLFVPYTPGQARDDLAVHAFTTLADVTAMAYRPAEALLDAQSIAAELWSAHVCERCRLGTTPPLDLSAADGHAALDPPMLLGLAHAGLAAMAHERVGEAAPIYDLGLLERLVADAGDGLLDGLDATGTPITIAPGEALDAWTLREGLALGIDAAARGPRNASRITPEILAGPDRLLDAIAMRTGPLWPMQAAPRPYDHDPPTVRITGPAPNSAHGPRTFRLTAVVTDTGGVADVAVHAPEGIAIEMLRETPDDIVAIVDATGHPDGPATLVVEATDRAHNVGRAEVTVEIDHRAPEIDLSHLDGAALETGPDDPYFTAANAFAVLATVDEPDAVVHTSERTGVQALGDGQFILGVRGYQPGQSQIDVVAVDPAGNAGRASFWLHYQSVGPRIDIVPTRYLPADRYGFEEVDCVPVAEEPGAPAACDIALSAPDEADEVVLDAAALAPDRVEPLEMVVFPSRLPGAPAPQLAAVVTDVTGNDVLRYRFRRADGEWTNWRIAAPTLRGAPGERTLELNGGSLETDRGEVPAEVQEVELQAIDAAGNATTRALRWRRVVIAPPVSWQRDTRQGLHADGHTPAGYRFDSEPPYFSARLLGAPNHRDLVDGIVLSQWLIHNPWPIPLTAAIDGQIHLTQGRTEAWRVDQIHMVARGLDGRVQAPCEPGEFYVSGQQWNDRRSPCSATPDVIAAGGMRLLGQPRRVGLNILGHAPDEALDDARALDPGGISLPAGETMVVIITADVVPLALLPDAYEAALPGLLRLNRVERGAPQVLSARAVERDHRITWHISGLEVSVRYNLHPAQVTRYYPPASESISLERRLLSAPTGFEWR